MQYPVGRFGLGIMGRREYKVFWGLEKGRDVCFRMASVADCKQISSPSPDHTKPIDFLHVVRCIGSLLDRCPCYTVVEHYAETASI